MSLRVEELEVYIAVGEFDAESDFEGNQAVYVARIEKDLVFSRSGVDFAHFVEEVAGALDSGLGEASGDGFELTVRPGILGGALDRLSDERPEIPVRTSLGGHLVWAGRDAVEFVAACGERLTFSRRDLELVLEEFGGR